MKKKIKPVIIVKIIAAIMLLWALADNPYGYYQILRWVVVGVAGYSAFIAYEHRKNVWAWIFGIITILYNPIAPIYLNREIWAVIDVIVAVIILASIFKLKIGTENRNEFAAKE